MTQVATPLVTRRTAGALADGIFKVLLAAACLAAAAPLGRLLGVPVWLLLVSGVALLICGGIELGCTRSRSMRTYTRLMIAYDTGWVLTALVGFLVAWRGGSAGGEVWVGYQTVAPLAFAVRLLASAPTRTAPDVTESPAR
ncbi:hypothetical protein IF655_28830 [Streptomyces sp. DSM 110735]|uniref:hypothetical protein n=1 Tax=Streptomyces sp. DSM 110735 TaxID=2775031 RepID=UPI0018F4195E|nr:hypothetical protein [Streptomyces sp. DSM 110735]MBJ7907299.1 hypothetical protein [Streptomyces sp. DSM 110735]